MPWYGLCRTIISPLSKEMKTVNLYVLLLSIDVSDGIPPKKALKEVHTNPTESRSVVDDNATIELILNVAIKHVIRSTTIHNSNLYLNNGEKD